jgi:hypothetical protein
LISACKKNDEILAFCWNKLCFYLHNYRTYHSKLLAFFTCPHYRLWSCLVFTFLYRREQTSNVLLSALVLTGRLPHVWLYLKWKNKSRIEKIFARVTLEYNEHKGHFYKQILDLFKNGHSHIPRQEPTHIVSVKGNFSYKEMDSLCFTAIVVLDIPVTVMDMAEAAVLC